MYSFAYYFSFVNETFIYIFAFQSERDLTTFILVETWKNDLLKIEKKIYLYYTKTIINKNSR